MDKQTLEKIKKKAEFSKILDEDVEKVFQIFSKREVSEEEKIRLTRELLHRVFSSFTSRKLISLKNKGEEWVLNKHLSTRERLPHYKEVYRRIFKNVKGKINIIDLGAGVNGFSYIFFPEEIKVNYLGFESMGQLVDLANSYFKKEKISGKMIQESLFNIYKIRNLIEREKGKKILFLFKTIEPLEMIEPNFSKKLILDIADLFQLCVVSFATESMSKRLRFKANKKWFLEFIKLNFKIKDDFEIGGERYIIFSKK